MSLPTSVLTTYQNNVWQMQMIADVTGKVLLEPYLSIDGSGNLQLSPVSMQSVINVPSDAASKSALSSNLGNVMQDAATNRFVAAIGASTYPYFTQAGYVNLEDGALFDSTGMTVGYTLYVTDLMALLQQLTVTVMRNATNQAALMYRAPAPTASATPQASMPQAQAPAPVSSYVPAMPTAQASAATYQPAPTYQPASAAQSQAAVGSSYVPATVSTPVAQAQQYQAPAVPAASVPAMTQIVKTGSMLGLPNPAPAVSGAPVVYSSNPQIAALQQQEASAKADMLKRQGQLATETIAHKQTVLRNAILTDQQQITADDKQIAALNGGSASGRSTLLGRLSSKIFKKKSHGRKQAKHAA